jgi:hypothetical protein
VQVKIGLKLARTAHRFDKGGTMGLSLTSAIIGLGLVIVGVTLLLLRKQIKFAVLLLIVGIALMVLPFSIIYFFYD